MNLMCNPGQIMKAKCTKAFKIKKYIYKIKLKWEVVFYNTAFKNKITTGSMSNRRKEGRKREKSVVIPQGLSRLTSPLVPGNGPLPSSQLSDPYGLIFPQPYSSAHHEQLANFVVAVPQFPETTSGPPGPASSPSLGPQWDPQLYFPRTNRTCTRHLICVSWGEGL